MRNTASLVVEQKFEIHIRAESDILNLRPISQQGKEWNLRDGKDQRERNFVTDADVPETCHRMRQVQIVLYSFVP